MTNKEIINSIPLSQFESDALETLIHGTRETAVDIGLHPDIIPEMMDIIRTAFLFGILTARESVPELSLN